MIARSPNNWLISFKYGVSPQPAHAPENSNSGSSNCAALHDVDLRLRAIELRNVEEEVEIRPLAFQVLLLRLHVDRFVPHDLLALGRANVDAHAAARAVVRRHLDREQMVGKLLVFPGLRLVSRPAHRSALRPETPSCESPRAGRPVRTSPQSMQMAGSQIGISAAMLRFSYLAVPVGNVPSTGIALTGR